CLCILEGGQHSFALDQDGVGVSHERRRARGAGHGEIRRAPDDEYKQRRGETGGDFCAKRGTEIVTHLASKLEPLSATSYLLPATGSRLPATERRRFRGACSSRR